jgi:peptidyl-prolyl cis-trans isomerase C
MRILLVGIVLVAVLGVLLGCSKEEAGQAKDQGEIDQLVPGDDIDLSAMAVKINGQVITNRQVAQEEGRLMQQLGSQVDAQQMGQMKDVVRKQALDNLISRTLLDQAVAREGVTASQGEIDARMAEIKAQMGSDEEFASRLAMMGMTEELLEAEMGTAIKVEKLIEKRGDAPEVTEADLKAYYDENRDRFKQPEQVEASHILIKVEPDDSDATKYEKRREAERVLGELSQGADFAQTATQHSACPSKQNGGRLGFFRRGQMVKPFEDAAFGLEVGQTSGIVETQFGYHIIRVTDRQESKDIPFEEARDGLAQYLDGQKKQEAMNSYIQGLRDAAEIEYAEPEATQ